MDKNEKMAEMLRRLKREMNGVAADSMREKGLRYGLSYGVSVPAVRRIARAYAPDHELALHLLRQDVRELKIAAFYVADPARVTEAEIPFWEREIGTDELAEHAAVLFHAVPYASRTVAGWLRGENPLLAKCAFYAAGRRAAAGLASEKESDGLLPEMAAAVVGFGTSVVRPAVYALCRCAACSESGARKVESLCAAWENGDDAAGREIASEVRALCGW